MRRHPDGFPPRRLSPASLEVSGAGGAIVQSVATRLRPPGDAVLTDARSDSSACINSSSQDMPAQPYRRLGVASRWSYGRRVCCSTGHSHGRVPRRSWKATEAAPSIERGIRDDRRLSVFRSYTFPYMDRPNLAVLTQAMVTRLMIDRSCHASRPGTRWPLASLSASVPERC